MRPEWEYSMRCRGIVQRLFSCTRPWNHVGPHKSNQIRPKAKKVYPEHVHDVDPDRTGGQRCSICKQWVNWHFTRTPVGTEWPRTICGYNAGRSMATRDQDLVTCKICVRILAHAPHHCHGMDCACRPARAAPRINA